MGLWVFVPIFLLGVVVSEKEYPKRRITPLTDRVLRLMKHHGFIKRIPGTLEGGLSFTVFRTVMSLCRWGDKGNINMKDAWRTVEQEIGKKDAQVLREIDSAFEPTKLFNDLVHLHLNDSEFLGRLKANRELAESVKALAKKLG